MTDDQRSLLDRNREKLVRSLRLVAASVERTGHFDPDEDYTPEELEPFDALSDRFMRAVESSIRFFRSYERFTQAVSSETLRDTLHRMEKAELVSDAEIWMEMRDVRNRIVHDYSPEQRQRLFNDIRGPYFTELDRTSSRAQLLRFDVL